MDYIKKLVIGNVELDNNIVLAPMAGVTDLPFRLLCKEAGVGRSRGARVQIPPSPLTMQNKKIKNFKKVVDKMKNAW